MLEGCAVGLEVLGKLESLGKLEHLEELALRGTEPRLSGWAKKGLWPLEAQPRQPSNV